MDRHQAAALYADRIEHELRRLSAWASEPPPDSAFESQAAFFADTMAFFQWLQFVLLPRIREIAGERGSFPSQSQVGAYAVRELDGNWEASDLISLLCEFDDFIEGHGHPPEPLPATADTVPAVSEPAPPEPSETPLDVAERYWRTLDRSLLHKNPHSPSSYDTELAEKVFASATGFVEFAGDAEPVLEGLSIRTVIQADRGAWMVLTVLAMDKNEWRVDLPVSLARTTMMFLHQHQAWPPYTETDDARGRAMQFWQHVLNRDDRRVRELLAAESPEISRFGLGQVDEFVWYVAHSQEGDRAVVRVLMNTHGECRTWLTRMIRRGGAWFVDLAATLAG